MASRAAPAGSAAATAPEPAHDVAQLPVANPGILIVGIMAASLLQVLDTTIANVAIPHMRTALGATTETITWVLTSYIIASAVALPITGWLADRVGGRRLFILSVAGFIMSSMLCGMAQNLEEMVLFRALQGVTGAFIAPLSQAFMLDTNKPSKHAQMMRCLHPLPAADVIVSHVPPHGVLDLTAAGEHIGSEALAHVPLASRPAVWCFGHVHEQRGAVVATGLCEAAREAKKGPLPATTRAAATGAARLVHGNDENVSVSSMKGNVSAGMVHSGPTTLFLNAANANNGRAVRWPNDRPPILVHINKQT